MRLSRIHIKILIAFLFSQLIIFATLAQSKYEINARDFTFEGMKFGTYLYKFQQKFPKSKFYKKNDDGTFSYLVELPSNSPSTAIFSFYNNKFTDILLSYQGLDKNKGVNLIEALMEKYGYPMDKSSTGWIFWNFPYVNRRIAIYPGEYEDEIILIIEDTTSSEERYMESERVDLGF